jgi:hypothetical protein
MDTILYGLRVRSNLQLPDCVAARQHAGIDLTVRFAGCNARLESAQWRKAQVAYRSPYLDVSGHPQVIVERHPDGASRLRYADEVMVMVNRDASEVVLHWEEHTSERVAIAYFLGPVLGWVMRLRGVICIHASVIDMEEQALLLVGSQGSGKSTTAATFYRRGARIAADDIAALEEVDNAFYVHSGARRLLLDESTALALFGSEEKLNEVAPLWGKWLLRIEAEDSRSKNCPMPIRAVYFLDERNRDRNKPMIRAVLGTAGLIRLVANTFANKILTAAQRETEFQVLSRFMDSIVLRTVSAPDDLTQLPTVCDAIQEDFRKLISAQ